MNLENRMVRILDFGTLMRQWSIILQASDPTLDKNQIKTVGASPGIGFVSFVLKVTAEKNLYQPSRAVTVLYKERLTSQVFHFFSYVPQSQITGLSFRHIFLFCEGHKVKAFREATHLWTTTQIGRHFVINCSQYNNGKLVLEKNTGKRHTNQASGLLNINPKSSNILLKISMITKYRAALPSVIIKEQTGKN